ncbi:MAG TPA: hypothetical protein VGF21_02505 [Thermoleophilaceae bacterium]
MLASRTRITLLTLVVALAFAVAPSAHAGPLVASAHDCPSLAMEQPFVRWLDPMSYVLQPGGSFESQPDGWDAGSASVSAGNEPWHVHGQDEASSLAIPAGGSVTGPTMCVGLEHPTLRFFARSSSRSLSTLAVQVIFEDAAGSVHSLPIGAVAPGGWAPTAAMPIVVNLLPLLPGELTPVRFRFTPVGPASWQIDDVYVDPRRQ